MRSKYLVKVQNIKVGYIFIVVKCCVERNGAQPPRQPCIELFLSVVYRLNCKNRCLKFLLLIKLCFKFLKNFQNHIPMASIGLISMREIGTQTSRNLTKSSKFPTHYGTLGLAICSYRSLGKIYRSLGSFYRSLGIFLTYFYNNGN